MNLYNLLKNSIRYEEVRTKKPWGEKACFGRSV